MSDKKHPLLVEVTKLAAKAEAETWPILRAENEKLSILLEKAKELLQRGGDVHIYRECPLPVGNRGDCHACSLLKEINEAIDA